MYSYASLHFAFLLFWKKKHNFNFPHSHNFLAFWITRHALRVNDLNPLEECLKPLEKRMMNLLRKLGIEL